MGNQRKMSQVRKLYTYLLSSNLPARFLKTIALSKEKDNTNIPKWLHQVAVPLHDFQDLLFPVLTNRTIT